MFEVLGFSLSCLKLLELDLTSTPARSMSSSYSQGAELYLTKGFCRSADRMILTAVRIVLWRSAFIFVICFFFFQKIVFRPWLINLLKPLLSIYSSEHIRTNGGMVWITHRHNHLLNLQLVWHDITVCGGLNFTPVNKSIKQCDRKVSLRTCRGWGCSDLMQQPQTMNFNCRLVPVDQGFAVGRRTLGRQYVNGSHDGNSSVA